MREGFEPFRSKNTSVVSIHSKESDTKKRASESLSLSLALFCSDWWLRLPCLPFFGGVGNGFVIGFRLYCGHNQRKENIHYEMIISDALELVREGRTPILLTERKDHAILLAEKLQGRVRVCSHKS